MPSEINIPLTTVYGFLLALARVSSIFVFIPIPGVRNTPAQVRIILVLAVTLALSGSWPDVGNEPVNTGKLIGWVLWEAGLGLAVGLAVSFMTEALGLAAQLIGVQAGYGFSSTIDPTTNADSTVLIILSQLLGGLLFFTLGLDRHLIAAFSKSLATRPPGFHAIPLPVGEQVIALGSMMFTTGLRLALPVAGLLALIDIALALVGRLSAHLQLLAVTFPAKMMVATLMLSATLMLYARVYGQDSQRVFSFVGNLLGN